MGYTSAERAEYMNQYREKRRAWAREHLGGKCVTCGTTEELEFDHIDPSTKVKQIASMLTESWKNFLAEVNKCQLLCEVHHELKTREAYAKQPRRWKHGKTTMYTKGGCRCYLCTTAQQARRRNEPARRRGTEGPGGPGVL